MKAAVYIRVSTRDGKQDTENQLSQLRDACKRWGYEIVQVYEDNESGGKGRQERKAFDQMFKDAQKGGFSIVVFWALDRFSRQGITMTLDYLRILESYGVGFRSLQEPYLNTDNELTRHILLATISYFAELERKRISERTKAGLERVRRQGKKLGRPSKHRKHVEKVKQLRGDGMSLRKIAEEVGVSVNTVRKCLEV